MRRKRQVQCFLHIILAAIFAAGIPGFAGAETLKAVPEQPLQAIVDLAKDGDIIEVTPGEYKGAIRIERRLVLTGRPGAVLNGGGAGSVIRVTAPDVTIRGLTIQGSGHDLQAMDSGVFLEKTAQRALVVVRVSTRGRASDLGLERMEAHVLVLGPSGKVARPARRADPAARSTSDAGSVRPAGATWWAS